MQFSTDRVKLTTGLMIKEMRQVQGLTQLALAKATNIPPSALSALEHDKARLGVKRAEAIARALHVHPSVLLWPNWKE